MRLRFHDRLSITCLSLIRPVTEKRYSPLLVNDHTLRILRGYSVLPIILVNTNNDVPRRSSAAVVSWQELDRSHGKQEALMPRVAIDHP